MGGWVPAAGVAGPGPPPGARNDRHGPPRQHWLRTCQPFGEDSEWSPDVQLVHRDFFGVQAEKSEKAGA